MIRPPYLKPGDKVAIIAPARKVPVDNLKAAVEIFKSWELEVMFGKNFGSNFHSYLGGSDQERLTDFQQAIDDDSVKAIISARGGYGSSRIVDQLDFSKLKEQPKWFIGFSDVTAVHMKLCRAGIMSIHGIMPMLFAKEGAQTSIESLRRILSSGDFSLDANKNPNNRHGMSDGKLIGGNLSIIVDALGTPTEPDTSGAILMIEEIEEYMYRVDRMMTHLKRAGKLKDLRGLVVGHMTDLKDPETFKDSYEQVILNAVSEYHYPVAFGFPFGHENPNLAWMQGAMVRLRVDEQGASIAPRQSLI